MASGRYTLTYRATEAQQVMTWFKAGQSGCIVGLRGVGASNFLHFLLREDTRRHYLGQGYSEFIFVLINLLALAEQSEQAVYDLILDRLLSQLSPDTAAEITGLRDQLPAPRALERGLDILCRRLDVRLVLLFDEFGPIFQNLTPSLFRYLRALRDSHKDQLAYIVVANDDLACLRDDLTEVEHFYRLVSRNVCGLGPYSETDAWQMIGYLASRRSLVLSEDDRAQLLELSGGHAGLLKAIMSLLWETSPEGGLAQISPTLADEPAVQAECWKVWAGLPEREQAGLRALLAGEQPDPQTFCYLQRKGLTPKSQPDPIILSPLFTNFIRRQTTTPTQNIVISRSPRQVQFDQRRIDGLTSLEFEALCYLYDHRGRVCDKDELIQHVYGQQYDRMAGGVSDAALQTLIARLRAKIEPDRSRARYILTVRGEGYRFVEPGEWVVGG